MRETLLSLADAMSGSDLVKAKAAKAAMAQQVHAACAPGVTGKLRAELLRELLTIILESKRPRLVRAHAIALLGFLGSKGDDKTLARLASDPELKDNIKMARERLRRGS
jgi:hypothetical protein